MKPLPAASRAGGIRGTIFFIILMAGLLWGGGQHTYTWWRNRKITSVDFADFLKHKPDAEWLELKDATLNMTHCAESTRYGKRQELYIPLVTSPNDDGPFHVVLHTKDPKYFSLLDQMNALKDQKSALIYALQNRDRIWPTADVRGIVEFGIDANDSDREKLQKLNLNLDKDFVMISDGGAPNIAIGAAMLAGGIVMLGLSVRAIFFRSHESAKTAVSVVRQASPPPLPPTGYQPPPPPPPSDPAT